MQLWKAHPLKSPLNMSSSQTAGISVDAMVTCMCT